MRSGVISNSSFFGFSMLHVPTVPAFPAKTCMCVVSMLGRGLVGDEADEGEEEEEEEEGVGLFIASVASARSFLMQFTTTLR